MCVCTFVRQFGGIDMLNLVLLQGLSRTILFCGSAVVQVLDGDGRVKNAGTSQWCLSMADMTTDVRYVSIVC